MIGSTLVREQSGSDAATRRRRAILAQHGGGALLPFQSQGDKRLFSMRGRDGVLAYGSAGPLRIVVGDPVGPDGWAVLDGFLEHARRHGRLVAVYQASEAARPALEARGLLPVPVGREAIIDLATFGLAGSRRANLRHTITRSGRGGVTVTWHPTGLVEGDDSAAALVALDRTWAVRAGPSMGFTITRFEPDLLGSSAIAIARGAGGEPIAFATFRAAGPGQSVLDLMRRKPGSVPGALEAAIAMAATAFREAGGCELSLGLAPLAGLDPESALLAERWLARGSQVARHAYDVDGLAFFKNKFDPRWETRYLAVPRSPLAPVAAIGLVWLHVARPGWSPPRVIVRAAVELIASIREQSRTDGAPRA